MISVGSTNINAKKFIEPAAFAALAFLAGSTRLVEYLPGSSLRGFFLSAGASTATSFFYDQALRDPEHSSFRTIVGKAVAIGLATTLSVLAAKALQGRVQLSPKGAIGFGAIQTFAVAIVVKATESTELEREWLQIMRHPHKLLLMSEEEKSQKAEEFYDAGLPLMPLPTIISLEWLPEVEDIDSLTDSELTWLISRYDTLKSSDAIKIMSRGSFCYDVPKVDIQELVNPYKGRGELIDLLYDWIVTYPVWFHMQEDEDKRKLSALLKDKPPIPPINLHYSPFELQHKGFFFSLFWMDYVVKAKHWNDISSEMRSYLTELSFAIGTQYINEIPYKELTNVSWLSNLSPQQIDELECYQKSYLAKAYEKDPDNFHHLSQEQKAVLDEFYRKI